MFAVSVHSCDDDHGCVNIREWKPSNFRFFSFPFFLKTFNYIIRFDISYSFFYFYDFIIHDLNHLHGVFLLMDRQIRAPITVDSTTTVLSLTVNSSHVNHRRNTRTTPIARQKENKPLAFGRCELYMCVWLFQEKNDPGWVGTSSYI